MRRAPLLLLAAAGLGSALAGCAARLSDDMFRLEEVDPRERALIVEDRTRQPTGGLTSLVPQPRFIYRGGALVDTNRARWYWIAGGPLAPPPPAAPEPAEVPP
jgi:hypothetical protein